MSVPVGPKATDIRRLGPEWQKRTGENKPVSGAQIAQALPDGTLQKGAQDAGVSTEQAADDIARSLPEAVDKLAPAGEVPKGGSIEDLIRVQAL
ncbi:YidB family protein [Streptomyces sp. NPDC005148]